MKNVESKSANEKQETDWTKLLVEIILKIITLGLYHVEKHKKKS